MADMYNLKNKRIVEFLSRTAAQDPVSDKDLLRVTNLDTIVEGDLLKYEVNVRIGDGTGQVPKNKLSEYFNKVSDFLSQYGCCIIHERDGMKIDEVFYIGVGKSQKALLTAYMCDNVISYIWAVGYYRGVGEDRRENRLISSIEREICDYLSGTGFEFKGDECLDQRITDSFLYN